MPREPKDMVTLGIVLLEAVGEDDRSAFLVMSSVMSALGGAVLALSLVGMYAVWSFTVARRTREIGILVALGATRRQILESVVGRAALLLAVGAGLGQPTSRGDDAPDGRLLRGTD